MSTISSVSSSTPTGSASDTLPGSSKPLNQNDFLKLLVTQIQYQDPLNPKSDTDMAAQMAQFTSLQQSTQMSSSLSLLQANSLVGDQVTLQVDSQHQTSGIVTGVDVSSGTPQVTVGGQSYDLKQVVSVTPPPAQTTSTTTPASSSSSSSSTP
jgi:flagellar basal-body rod modification protein FlgD